jgi:hypothetical protein
MQIVQGIESGVASINCGNKNQQTTTNLTNNNNNPDVDNLDLVVQKAFVPTDHFDIVNSDNREREWKIEHERNKEEWKREKEEREELERQWMREEQDCEQKEKDKREERE